MQRLGRARLTTLLIKSSRGAWREDKADDLLLAARGAIELWADGGIDFAGVAADIESEVRMAQLLGAEIARVDERIEALYGKADPAGIVLSAPGLGVTLAAGILGRPGDARRFGNLAGVRGFSGMVPGTDQSGTSEGRQIVKDRFTVPTDVRAARRRTRLAQAQKQGTSRRRKGSQNAPAASPSPPNATGQDAAA